MKVYRVTGWYQVGEDGAQEAQYLNLPFFANSESEAITFAIKYLQSHAAERIRYTLSASKIA